MKRRFRFEESALTIAATARDRSWAIATDAIARQLIRAGTGVCANHRAAGRARSRREFIAKLAVVVEEADEAELWLEALLKCALAPSAAVDPLYREAAELRAIFCQSLHTARANLVREPNKLVSEPNKRRAEKPGFRSTSVLP